MLRTVSVALLALVVFVSAQPYCDDPAKYNVTLDQMLIESHDMPAQEVRAPAPVHGSLRARGRGHVPLGPACMGHARAAN
jgi:hypothetical protein